MAKRQTKALDPASAAILAELPEWMFDAVARACAQESIIEVLLLILLDRTEPAKQRDFLNDMFAKRAEVNLRVAESREPQFAADLAVATDLHINRIVNQAIARLAESSVGVPKN